MSIVKETAEKLAAEERFGSPIHQFLIYSEELWFQVDCIIHCVRYTIIYIFPLPNLMSICFLPAGSGEDSSSNI